ncbi:SDR family NAD(P)-dependent oxidoreductase [Aspergillus niger CBS 101883]|uniref:SDR family NAD(P)-dependent oxidoreductase n=1 Tax=Aspergillus lacticoffeatus (strain CBS 101883) TaxID=1450533 RepID=UPI000D7F67D1|nr:NAD(P)-binding protein [Aspergillus niger CBS 101883]PYH55847.1 NAD(P)-binding protein [Aspergillus niger CBS 101883]
MAYLLHGTAFITGAGSGIGAGVARTFSQNGISKLALIDINPSSLQKASESLRQRSPDVELLTAAVDVTNEAHVDNAVQKAATKFGRVDIGVNCAGVCDPKEPTDRLSLKDWQRTININQTGVWLSQRALIRQMLTQTSRDTRHGRGVIINVCPSLGITASATGMPYPAYTSSKHGTFVRTAQGIFCSGLINIYRRDGAHENGSKKLSNINMIHLS